MSKKETGEGTEMIPRLSITDRSTSNRVWKSAFTAVRLQEKSILRYEAAIQ